MTRQLNPAQHFHITISGKGAHAARPHEGIDVIVIGSHIISALYALPGRSHTLGITRLSAGNSWNVLPHTAEIDGIWSGQTEQAPAQITALISGIAAGFGAQTAVDWRPTNASTA